MRNMLSILAILFAALLLTNPLYAQDDERNFSIGAKAGWFFFDNEDLSDGLGSNWTLAGEIKMWLPGGFGLGAEVQYLSIGEKDTEFGGIPFDVDYSQIPIHVNAFYRIPTGNGMFYVGGGGSFVFTDIDISTDVLFFVPIETTADATTFGFNGVAGFQYGHFFIEGQWLWAEAEFNILSFTVAEDVQVGGPSIWAGVRF